MAGTSSLRMTYGYSNISETDPGGSVTDTLGPITYAQPYGPGTSPGNCDKFFRDSQSLTNAAATYDLSALVGVTSGLSVSGMLHCRMLRINFTGAIGSGGTAVFGPAGTFGWTNGLGGNIPATPGSCPMLPWPDAGAPAIAAGSNCRITITVTGTMTFTIDVLGTST